MSSGILVTYLGSNLLKYQVGKGRPRETLSRRYRSSSLGSREITLSKSLSLSLRKGWNVISEGVNSPSCSVDVETGTGTNGDEYEGCPDILSWEVCGITLGICWGCRWGSGSCMPRTETPCTFHITGDESFITVPIISCKVNNVFLFFFICKNSVAFYIRIHSRCNFWKELHIYVWLNFCDGVVVVSQRVFVIMCEFDMYNSFGILWYEIKDLYMAHIALVNV